MMCPRIWLYQGVGCMDSPEDGRFFAALRMTCFAITIGENCRSSVGQFSPMVIAKHVILSGVEESPVFSIGRAAEAITGPFARTLGLLGGSSICIHANRTPMTWADRNVRPTLTPASSG